jgi:hypothetical protein
MREFGLARTKLEKKMFPLCKGTVFTESVAPAQLSKLARGGVTRIQLLLRCHFNALADGS